MSSSWPLSGDRIFLGSLTGIGNLCLSFRVSEQLHRPVGIDLWGHCHHSRPPCPPGDLGNHQEEKVGEVEMAELAGKPRNILELKGVYKDFDGLRGPVWHQSGGSGGGASRHHRPERGGQKHAFQFDHRKISSQQGKNILQGRGYYRSISVQTQPAGDGPLLPDHQYFPDHDRLPECAQCGSLQEQDSL